MPTIVNKTIKAAGGDYTSLANLEAANANLVALDEVWIVTADNLEETAAVNFTGWVTDSTRYLHVRAANRHGSSGRVTTNAFRLVVNGTCLTVNSIGNGGLMIFEGLQLKCTSAVSRCIAHSNNGVVTATVRYIDCVLESAGEGYHADGGGTSTNDAQFINCVGICVNACVVREFRDISIYSCTFISTGANQHCCNFGLNDGRSKIVKSSYARSAGGGGALAYNSVYTGDQAASSDASGSPASVRNIAYTTANFTSVTASSEDLTLPAGSALLGIGADRTAEAAPFNYTTDIRGNTRELVGDDNGAFERVVASSENTLSLWGGDDNTEDSDMSKVIELDGQATGILNKDMKAAANTQYPSGIIDGKAFRNFLVALAIDNTGGGANGTAKLTIILLDDDGATVVGTIDILTAIATTADANVLVAFGRGLAAVKSGGGTIGTEIEILKLVKKFKVQLEVTQASNGTTCTATVRLFMGN